MAMTAFSLIQTSHLLEPHLYGAHFFSILHAMSNALPDSFRPQTYLDKDVPEFSSSGGRGGRGQNHDRSSVSLMWHLFGHSRPVQSHRKFSLTNFLSSKTVKFHLNIPLN